MQRTKAITIRRRPLMKTMVMLLHGLALLLLLLLLLVV